MGRKPLLTKQSLQSLISPNHHYPQRDGFSMKWVFNEKKVFWWAVGEEEGRGRINNILHGNDVTLLY